MKVLSFHLKNNYKKNFIVKDVLKNNKKTINKNNKNKINKVENGLLLKINKMYNNYNISINNL